MDFRRLFVEPYAPLYGRSHCKEVKMSEFEGKIKGSDGVWRTVRIQARDRLDAQKLLEAQYGKANVMIVYAVN